MAFGMADLQFESALWAAGRRRLAGVDEAGRGALAGPVVAAAVLLSPDRGRVLPLLGRVNDSKQLTPGHREQLYGEICGAALSVGVGLVDVAAIDRDGIGAASRRAMLLAVDALAFGPDYLLIDYVTLAHSCPQLSLVHGDARSLAIAAASVIAKVTRDRCMVVLGESFPGYGFGRHKGYGTTEHLEALARLGPCKLHRRSFSPVGAGQMGLWISETG